MNTIKLTGYTLAVAASLLLVACGGGGGGGGGGDTTAPTVSSTEPADGATGVDPGIAPGITFSETMLNTSIDNTTLLLQGTAAVPATVSFDGDATATLTPDAPLALLTAYTATATTAVTDLSGNPLASAANWTFTTRDGLWQAPQLLEINNVGDAFSPQIAVDANGNALAVWTQSDGSRDNIQANRYTPASGWGTAELIESDDAGGAFSPQIALDANGNALAVWYQFDGTRRNILANRYTPAGGWGTAELIETDDAGDAFSPQIAVDANGNALAVWYQFDGSRFNIWANRFTPASGWGAAELIESNAGYAYDPQIALDANGNALAVWYQFDGTRNNIWANRYTPAGGWGAAELIESDNAGHASSPQIALDANGNALAVWYQFDGTRNNIQANRFTPAGGWGAAELIETDNARSARFPQIALDANGNALAVWRQSDGARNNIWANRFTPAGGWGAAGLIESDVGDADAPQIALDANGNALAVWYQHDGAVSNIQANRFE